MWLPSGILFEYLKPVLPWVLNFSLSNVQGSEGLHWKEWCWSWNSNTLATWCEELTHLKRPWCWERLRAGGEGHDRGWDGWMASLTQWTCIWVSSGSWWCTGKPGMLQSMGSQKVRHHWATELKCAGRQLYWTWTPSSMTIPFCVLPLDFYNIICLFGHTGKHAELPQPKIEPRSPAVEACSVNCWTTNDVASL